MMSLTNDRIYNYYKANPGLDFETMNLLLLDFMGQMNQDMTRVLHSTIQGQVLQEVKDLKTTVGTFQASLTGSNRDFLDSIKQVLSSGEQNDHLLTRLTETFVQTIIPATDSRLRVSVQAGIQEEFAKTRQMPLTDFLLALDTKLSLLQQPLVHLLQSNQDQLATRFSTVRDELLGNKVSNDLLYGEMNDFLQKYKASSQHKGQYSENMLETTLTEMYPTASIENTTAQVASGDFMIRRDGLPDVLVENKNYVRNVDLEEIRKFLRDVTSKKCSGIMMSQLSGIVSKPNLFIDIHDGKVLVYLHRVHFSKDQIKLAMDIIDHLTSRLESIVGAEAVQGISIKKEVLDKINEDLQTFIKSKDAMAASIRDTQKVLLGHLDKLQLPELSLYLTDKYASIHHQEFRCDVCGFIATTKRGMTNHVQSHNKLKKQKT